MFSYIKNTFAGIGAISAFTLLCLCHPARAETFYVDQNFQGENPTGTSWLSAFRTIQAAIDAAAEAGGGDVWVKAGVHKPDDISRNTAIRLKPRVSIYGGFRGGETELKQRNSKANRTILSGDIGRVSATSDNCYHVLVAANECRIDGFIISRGNANATAENRFGGGLLVPPDTEKVQVANCTFEKNNAESGGAMYFRNSSVELTNCTFYSNSAESGGAVAAAGSSDVKIHASIFSSNFAPSSGGAITLEEGAAARILKTSFLYNSTDGQGGAISVHSKADSPVELNLTECNFTENSARENGGALALHGSFKPVVTSCTFERNFSTKGSGAMVNSDGVLALVENTTFTGNRGLKGHEDIGNDETSVVAESREEALALAKNSPIYSKLNPTPPPEKINTAKPAPKPKRKLADVFVYNEKGTKIKLRSIVAGSQYTVLVLGELTDPDFIKSYRNIEAAARDYTPKGIHFLYIYRYLSHPENNGYIQPFNLKERSRQAMLAREQLATTIPWLCDLMDNQTAKALAPNAKKSVFIFDANGTETYSGSLTDDAGFRTTLLDIAGPIDSPTAVDALPAPTIQPQSPNEAKLVKRVVVNAKAEKFLPLQITPMESNTPFYVKVRVEGNESVRSTGDGKIYLGFHIDPLYKTEWNNLGEPLRYALKTPNGVVAPSINSAPRITSQATDSEPREFLLNARKLDINKPVALRVTYSVHSSRAKRNIEVTQHYIIYLSADPFGGAVFGRQDIKNATPPPQNGKGSSPAFQAMLRRFDLDRNGKLTEDEVIGRLRSNFSEIDTNQDGAIGEVEYMQYRAKQ